jgi:hypothetical protein
MSIFASRATRTLEIPGDSPHTVTIQKLAGRHLAQAMLENQLHSIDTFRKMGGAQFQKELNAIRDDAKADAAKPVEPTVADPMAGYDRDVLMQHGIVSWSYPETVADMLPDLTDEAADFFAREILKLSKPGLFLTADENEAATKNG